VELSRDLRGVMGGRVRVGLIWLRDGILLCVKRVRRVLSLGVIWICGLNDLRAGCTLSDGSR
jgi:hypothetical protein